MVLSVAANVSSRFYSSYPDRDIRRTVRPPYGSTGVITLRVLPRGTECVFLIGYVINYKRVASYRERMAARQRLQPQPSRRNCLGVRRHDTSLRCIKVAILYDAIPAVQNVIADDLVRIAGILLFDF